MRKVFLSILSATVLLTGCRHPPPPEPPYSYYRAPQFQWRGVARVLIMPLDNETDFPHAADEVRNSLVTEMQRLGLFEVVPAPPDVPVDLCRVIRENGRFNEAILVQLARTFRADAIIMGAVTQYSPYTLPRLGVVLQVVSPGDAAVMASVDGVWDAASRPIAERARAFYSQRAKPRDEPFTAELVLDSPRLYQRFVCFEAAQALVGASVTPPVVVVESPPVEGPPQLPPPRMMPAGETAQSGEVPSPTRR